MDTNPFDNQDGAYLVLVNQEGQYSLWPPAVPTPAGWTEARPVTDRASALRFVDENWTDLRPSSLITAMEA